jgi:nicotinamidase-related amidase
LAALVDHDEERFRSGDVGSGASASAVRAACSGTHLHKAFKDQGVDTLVVTGAETDVCVLSTVLGAIDLGYRIVVVSDGVCSSADQPHDHLLALYSDRFSLQVETAECREVLEAWVA